MLNKLHIRNYKSIRELSIQPKRMNVFIGEHNSGKSNILEALGLIGLNAVGNEKFNIDLRIKSVSDLFYDSDISKPVSILTDENCALVRYGKHQDGHLTNELELILFDDKYQMDISPFLKNYSEQDRIFSYVLEFNGKISRANGHLANSHILKYDYKRIKDFSRGYKPYLEPPYGTNIPSLIISNPKLKEMVSGIFRERGFRLTIKPSENLIEMTKDVNDVLYSYQYQSISETMQRIIFYSLVVESNKDSTIVLDEPETNTFPIYTKRMGELFAQDKSNQYFITTHDPYLLGSILHQCDPDELNIYVVKMQDYQTDVHLLDEEKMAELNDMGYEVFFGLDSLI